MAAGSLLMLLDDIATVLDDVAILTKVAAKKTAGVLGDDLALNAEQVSGVRAERELPVVWAVARGSFINKVILVPAALAISVVIPAAIIPLLMIGGAFLCFEGAEKLAHKFLHDEHEDDAARADRVRALADETIDPVALERDKIKGAIRTDFILSAEIVVITLGTVAAEVFSKQVTVLTVVALGMTIGVYGLVAGIGKIDDAGLNLSRRGRAAAQTFGRGLLVLAPWLMKFLSIVGTAAMFLVGGGILVHGVPVLHHAIEHTTQLAGGVPAVGVVLGPVSSMLLNGLIGLAAGALLVAAMTLVQKLRPRRQ